MSVPLTPPTLSRATVGTAWLAGPAAVGLGFGAHALAAPAPPLALVAALIALTSLVATVLIRLRVPGWALFLASALVQQGLHIAFTMFTGSFTGGTLLGHSHDGPIAVPGAPGAPALDPHAAELLLYLHTAAALLTVVLVAGAAKGVAWWGARRSAAPSH